MLHLLRRLRARLKYRHFERDLAREIEVHRAMKEDELRASGIQPSEARSEAHRSLGNVTCMREEARSVWIARWIESLWQDARFGVAALRRNPMLGLGTIVMLGLGLGLVTTVFTIADATLFRPWRVPDPETVLFVRPAAPSGTDFAGISVPEFRYLREHSRAFRQLAVTVRSARTRVFYGADAFETVGSMTVSTGYFELLGVQIVAGRSFLPEEDTTTSPSRVIVISERLWTERFNRDPSTIGRTVLLDRTPFTIVGVVTGSFLDGHDSRTEVWKVVSLAEYADPRHREFPRATLGRLSNGVTPTQAISEIEQLSAAFRASHQLPAVPFRLVDTRPGGDNDRLQVFGLVFFGLILVQLVACANVGNLLLARAISRQREIAIRLSLGAGRWRVVRQLITEISVMSVLAGLLGLAIAVAVPRVVVAIFPEPFQTAAFYSPRAITFGFVFAMSMMTALACGLTPALRATRVSVTSLSSRSHSKTRTSARLRRGLLALQVSLAMLLLTAAGLLTRALGHASNADPGFAIGAFQEISVQFPAGSQAPRRTAFYEQLIAATRTRDWPPLSFAQSPPVFDDRYSMFLRTTPTSPIKVVTRRNVTANHFDVLGIALFAGRTFDERDEREIVISREVAEGFWPGESPIGRTLIEGSNSRNTRTRVVVGIAPDLPVRTLSNTDPVAYAMTSFFVDRGLLRGTDPRAVERLREVARRIDPDVTLSARPLREILEDSLFFARIGSRVAWSIGAMGLLLATMGAFSLFTQAVEERRREIGIRMALGARAAQIVGLVLRTTQRSILIGLGFGLLLAASSAQLLRRYLYGLSPFDPVSYLQIAGILGAAALLATWLPAVRATRVNPADTLRSE